MTPPGPTPETPRIVCDANMAFAAEAFETLGRVRCLEGRDIRPRDVRDADLLLTRSTTRIDRALLENSRVRFYATATIGHDHVDTAYLDARGIEWAGAAGCNAESVAQYLTAALTVLARVAGTDLAGRTLGVVGVGNVGRRVAVKARALGLRIRASDPPRQRNAADVEARAFEPLPSLLAHSDIVTLHVPLHRAGRDRTLGMADRAFFDRMPTGAWLINAARGEIVRAAELMRALDRGRVALTAIDTWNDEPRVSTALLERATIATPHIAGHSLEGKVNGTVRVYAAACRFLGVEPRWQPRLPPPPVPAWSVPPELRTAPAAAQVAALVCASYDILADDRRLRDHARDPDPAARAVAFDRLRKNYPVRREFASLRVDPRNTAPAFPRMARDLGFDVS